MGDVEEFNDESTPLTPYPYCIAVFSDSSANMAAKNFVFCTSLLLLLLLGLYNYIINVEKNACEMTWMWEKPEYQEVAGLPESVQNLFPHYSLHLYGEGAYAQRSKNMKLNGIPVLFIPGNAGSYKQDYVHVCLKHILSLYGQSKNPPQSVVIVGHSVGGILARALFTLPDFDPSLVHTIITQASPHRAPVVEVDRPMTDFYHKVNQMWKKNQNSSVLQKVTVLSVGGGGRDHVVRAGLTLTKDIIADDRRVDAVSTAIPNVWASADHLCIVWCRQLVLATKRAMFDMIDPTTKQISTDAEFKMEIFRHHFDRNSGRNKPSVKTQSPPKYTGKKWVTVNENIWNKPQEMKKPAENTHYMLPLSEHMYDSVVIISNINRDQWISGCVQTNGSQCLQGIDISHKAEVIPPLYTNYKVLHESIADFTKEKISHLVITVPKLLKTDIKVEFYNSTERRIQFTSPNVFLSAQTHTVIEETQPGQTFVNMELQGFNLVHQAHNVMLTPIKCQDDIEPNANVTMRMFVPWYREDVYSVSKATEANKLLLRLQMNRPANDERLVQVHMYLNPKCQYKVEMKSSFSDCMGQVIRFYAALLPSFIVNNIILAFSRQLQLLSTNEICQSFTYVQSDYNKPFKVVPFVVVLKLLVGIDAVDQVWQSLRIPKLDVLVMEDNYFGFGAVGLVMFIFAYAVIWLVAHIITILVKTAGKIIMITLARKIEIKKNTVSTGSPWLLYLFVGVLLSLSMRLCGTVGLVLGLIIYFFKVARHYAVVERTRLCLNLPEQSHESSKKEEDKDSQISESLLDAENTFHYQFTILLLWCALVALNFTPLVLWIKNMQLTMHLANDPSILTSIPACVSLMFLLDPRYKLPANRSRLPLISKLMLFSCIGLASIGMLSFYRVSLVIAGVLGIVAFGTALDASI
uniref:GPI inositol-deacylase n=1 Tax=Saccoglossus kowalevskii TaxID=10224 RepID=A0ABM0MGR5_SACKO|nr:PREDICTED: GPI inositol-deacylase-like [Saccoglossus kowalevskii]